MTKTATGRLGACSDEPGPPPAGQPQAPVRTHRTHRTHRTERVRRTSEPASRQARSRPSTPARRPPGTRTRTQAVAGPVAGSRFPAAPDAGHRAAVRRTGAWRSTEARRAGHRSRHGRVPVSRTRRAATTGAPGNSATDRHWRKVDVSSVPMSPTKVCPPQGPPCPMPGVAVRAWPPPARTGRTARPRPTPPGPGSRPRWAAPAAACPERDAPVRQRDGRRCGPPTGRCPAGRREPHHRNRPAAQRGWGRSRRREWPVLRPSAAAPRLSGAASSSDAGR